MLIKLNFILWKNKFKLDHSKGYKKKKKTDQNKYTEITRDWIKKITA